MGNCNGLIICYILLVSAENYSSMCKTFTKLVQIGTLDLLPRGNQWVISAFATQHSAEHIFFAFESW